MKKYGKTAETAIILLMALTLTVVGAFAAEAGTQSDPLVTMSYLNGTFMNEIMSKVESLAGGKGTGDSFTVVTLSSGNTMKLSLGAEVMLRVGSAKCVASSEPGLIDTTGGTVLAGGKALTANHLYMTTVDGRGIQATASTVKVLVRGTYTVS